MEKLAHVYNEFQNNYGQSIFLDYKHVIENLFSPDFKKIANGSLLVPQRDRLEEQLASVKEFAGSWIIERKNVIASANNNQCAIRYILNSDKAGKFDVIAIIKSDDGKKIDHVDEIYYQIK